MQNCDYTGSDLLFLGLWGISLLLFKEFLSLLSVFLSLFSKDCRGAASMTNPFFGGCFSLPEKCPDLLC